ncbi:MoxR family ATPase [Bacteroidales bacterium OttesenSCG-928-I14]|nr:MoxR family ATPase [Bacteroidales bacterium OttesenSCG-928-I14]
MSELENSLDLTTFSEKVNEIKKQISTIIVGQEAAVDLILTAILANGHILIEGVPGVAKTLLVKVIAKLIKADYSRIQFTPDLMPSDVLGTSVFNMKTSEFDFHKGPIFSELVLIDEINRAPAKTQAALFEVMEERQVTIDGQTRRMSDLYMVLATQNPIEQEGTYRLPEAQLDRFLMKININYPNQEEEFTILKRHHENIKLTELENLQAVIEKTELLKFKNLLSKVFVEDSLLKYITEIVLATRNSSAIYLGASPRASVALLNTAKAYALLQGRDFVIPDDIKYVSVPVLQHRIQASPETEMQGQSTTTVIKRIIEKTEVPK